MKLLAIGDIHGRQNWKTIVVEEYDQIVFLGDFADSHTLEDSVIYDTFQQIVRLKRSNPARVVLLIGNHDAQYLHYPHYSCSGFRPSMLRGMAELFRQNRELFQIAYQYKNYLFSHAGVSQSWLTWIQGVKTIQQAPCFELLTRTETLAKGLNQLHTAEPALQEYLFAVSPIRGGLEPYGGPVWADQRETRYDYPPGLHQVVGHTPLPDITTFGDESGSITYCDVLGTQAAFFEKTV